MAEVPKVIDWVRKAKTLLSIRRVYFKETGDVRISFVNKDMPMLQMVCLKW